MRAAMDKDSTGSSDTPKAYIAGISMINLPET